MRTFALVVLVSCGRSSNTTDAQSSSGSIDAVVDADDGTPMRQPCSDQFGAALSTTYGRLDGRLVAIVMPGTGACNADRDHIHLQVIANGSLYDVSVNVGTAGNADVHTTTRELWLSAWSEGWHTGIAEDYVALGVHSSQLTLGTPNEIANAVAYELNDANHISVFGIGYGPEGAHLVHRNGGGRDGMLVIRPLSSPAHARLFSFSDQAF